MLFIDSLSPSLYLLSLSPFSGLFRYEDERQEGASGARGEAAPFGDDIRSMWLQTENLATLMNLQEISKIRLPVELNVFTIGFNGKVGPITNTKHLFD